MLLRYLSIWFVLALVAVANGLLREYTYGRFMSGLPAHQLSTVTAIIASGVVVWWAARYWPIESAGSAWLIGVLWLVMTVAFEFGFGHFVAGHEWRTLLADYNILAGRVWGLFLCWVLVLPYLAYRF